MPASKANPVLLSQGCKWAAITIIVVSAPVLGKVTQVSFERTIGTTAGGLLGYVTVILGHKMLEASDVVFTGECRSLHAAAGIFLLEADRSFSDFCFACAGLLPRPE